MTDIASRLESVRDRLAGLREELTEAGQTRVAERVQALASELEAVIRDAAPRPAAPSRRRFRAVPVERCPRCSIRSLHMIPEETRRSDVGFSEVLWRCSSCGHELWFAED